MREARAHGYTTSTTDATCNLFAPSMAKYLHRNALPSSPRRNSESPEAKPTAEAKLPATLKHARGKHTKINMEWVVGSIAAKSIPPKSVAAEPTDNGRPRAPPTSDEKARPQTLRANKKTAPSTQQRTERRPCSHITASTQAAASKVESATDH